MSAADHLVAVIFEVVPASGQRDAYLDQAARLKPLLEQSAGFVSVERFESLTQPGKLLSLQFWRDDEAVRRWRNQEVHRRVQQAGRKVVFADYRLRVAQVIRSYGKYDRAEAPADSKAAHGV